MVISEFVRETAKQLGDNARFEAERPGLSAGSVNFPGADDPAGAGSVAKHYPRALWLERDGYYYQLRADRKIQA